MKNAGQLSRYLSFGKNSMARIVMMANVSAISSSVASRQANIAAKKTRAPNKAWFAS